MKASPWVHATGRQALYVADCQFEHDTSLPLDPDEQYEHYMLLLLGLNGQFEHDTAVIIGPEDQDENVTHVDHIMAKHEHSGTVP